MDYAPFLQGELPWGSGVHRTRYITFVSFFLVLGVSLWRELQISLSPSALWFACLFVACSISDAFHLTDELGRINVTTVFKYPRKYTGSPKYGTTIGWNKVTYLLQLAFERDRTICMRSIFLSSRLSCLLSCALGFLVGASFSTPHLFPPQCKYVHFRLFLDIKHRNESDREKRKKARQRE